MQARRPATSGGFDEEALKQGVQSIRHPLTRALLLLTFSTGLVDAASYLGLGHVFTANMTGNVVLLGFGLAGSGGLPIVAPLVSLGCFVFGAGSGGVLVARAGERHPALVARALGIEAGLIAASAGVAGIAAVRPGNAAAYLVIALTAFAMGVRNAIVRRIDVPDMTTTVLTRTLTALAAESRFAGGSGIGSVRRMSAVASMLAGALGGALLLRSSLAAPLGLAAALALAIWALYVPAAVSRGAGAAR